MKKIFVLITLMLSLALVACGSGTETPENENADTPTAAPAETPAAPDPITEAEPAPTPETAPAITRPCGFTPVTGWDMMERLGVGIAIGNTLDAHNHGNPYWGGCPVTNWEREALWGGVEMEQWHFESIAMMGFDSVRITIHWQARMDDDWNIDPRFMARVQEVVDWALAEGLYVLINSHHAMTFYDFIWYEDLAEASRWITTLWGQIGEHFQDYPEQLLFEIMNEPPARWGWDINSRQGIRLREGLVDLNFAALESIRSSGGNNDKRVVLLSPVASNSDYLRHYVHPENDPYTMASFMFYPSWMGCTPGREHESEMRAINFIASVLERGIPLVNKETSSLTLNNSVTRTNEQQLAWTSAIYGEFARLGIPSIWWNTSGASFDQLLTRATGEWNEPMLEAFFAAYGKTRGESMEAPNRPANSPGQITTVEYFFYIEDVTNEEQFHFEATGEGWQSFNHVIPAADGEYSFTFDFGGITRLYNLGFIRTIPGSNSTATLQRIVVNGTYDMQLCPENERGKIIVGIEGYNGLHNRWNQTDGELIAFGDGMALFARGSASYAMITLETFN
jgi:endoglucanase